MNRDKLIVLIFYKLCTTRIIMSKNSIPIGIDLLPLDILLFRYLNTRYMFYINFILLYYFILSLQRQLILIIRRNNENELNLSSIEKYNNVMIKKIFKIYISEI